MQQSVRELVVRMGSEQAASLQKVAPLWHPDCEIYLAVGKQRVKRYLEADVLLQLTRYC